MARQSRLPLGVFALDARRHAIVLSMKDSSNAPPAVAAILSPARNRLMPLCLLRAFLRRGSEPLQAQGLDGCVCLERRLDRERDSKSRPVPRGTLHGDTATLGYDDLLHDVES